MKPLLPTMKEKKRYLVYELISERPLGNPEKAVLSHLECLGIFDGARAGIQSVRYDAKKQKGVLRVAHTSVDKVRAALMLLEEVDGVKVAPRTCGVSGILKKTERFM